MKESLAVRIYGAGETPKSLSSNQSLGMYRQDDEHWQLLIRDPVISNRTLLSNVLDVIDAHGVKIWNAVFSLFDNTFADEVVCFKTLCMPTKTLNGIEDYSPHGSAPHFGRLLSDRPLILNEIPSGPVASPANELIYHKSFYDLLVKHGIEVETDGEVRFRDRRLDDWYRLTPRKRQSVIDARFIRKLACVFCGELILCDVGLVFGKSVSEPVVFDELKMGHLALEDQLLLSPNMIPTFKVHHEFGFEPVYSSGGLLAEQVSEVMDALSPFMGGNPSWRIDPEQEYKKLFETKSD